MSCCARCGQGICTTAGKITLNKVWHRNCFCCYNCGTPLDVNSAKIFYGEVFCKCCYCLLESKCPPLPISCPSNSSIKCRKLRRSQSPRCGIIRDSHSCSCLPNCCQPPPNACQCPKCCSKPQCRPKSTKPLNYPPRPTSPCRCPICCKNPCEKRCPSPCSPCSLISPCCSDDSDCPPRPKLFTQAINRFECLNQCSGGPMPCTRKWPNMCQERCRRCNQKVFAAEKITTSNGPYHLGCFTCYCCCKALCVKTMYEANGEIFCRNCYNNYFGINDYGYTSSCC